ncbi:MAG TPA: hypothetical protein VMN60_07265 [Longimicrobiales bacterium]|nr:hypothetical protein [Longimicrobiales bacterium]
MRKTRTLLPLVLVSLFVSCEHEVGPLSSSGDIRFAIVDGSGGGNPHFFFLPPIMRDPGPRPAGSFDAALAPEVVVCWWTGSSCAAEVARYTMTSGPGSETIRCAMRRCAVWSWWTAWHGCAR